MLHFSQFAREKREKQRDIGNFVHECNALLYVYREFLWGSLRPAIESSVFKTTPQNQSEDILSRLQIICNLSCRNRNLVSKSQIEKMYLTYANSWIYMNRSTAFCVDIY